MKRAEQRAAIDLAFCETLTRYRELRAGEFNDAGRHDGAVSLGKVLQTISLALRLEIIDYAEYEAYMARVRTTEGVTS